VHELAHADGANEQGAYTRQAEYINHLLQSAQPSEVKEQLYAIIDRLEKEGLLTVVRDGSGRPSSVAFNPDFHSNPATPYNREGKRFWWGHRPSPDAHYSVDHPRRIHWPK